MKEIILKMKLVGGACIGIPFFMKKRTLYTLIFTNTDYKKGILQKCNLKFKEVKE